MYVAIYALCTIEHAASYIELSYVSITADTISMVEILKVDTVIMIAQGHM